MKKSNYPGKVISTSSLNEINIEMPGCCRRHGMSASSVLRMVDGLLKRYKVEFISMAGGELFLHGDCGRFLGAMLSLREKKKIPGLGLYGNMVCFDGMREFFLAHRGRLDGLRMGISIDGKEGTHDRLRGVGSYRKALRAVEWLTGNFGKDIILQLKFTINRVNYAELHDAYDLARRFNVEFSPKILEVPARGYRHGYQIPGAEDLVPLTAAMNKSVCDQIRRMLKDDYPGNDGPLLEATMLLLKDGKKCIRACMTPARVLVINSRRDIYSCPFMPPVGKVGVHGVLPEGLDEARQRQMENARQGICPRCVAFPGFLKRFNLPYLAGRKPCYNTK
jgi:MoaA/NifB/PqqE/SkfB family radical SAM enzyme